ncbi:hypothetical protein SELMODRAFT_123292 [Selaginella moellendorffii]|uniref:Pentacotripeptide-repeat region of PRORP domain-containing protein n=2 Tax=Selaginella moellendorffii TaxID=88036 RepID=D8SRW4_SELML|nr:hypothetical protein SELMODRAFT_123292 [Selaginella moellendorffii]
MLAVCSGDETLEFFGRMAQAGFTPSEVSFVSVLAACSHKGDVELGRSYFVGMWADFGIEATVDHYACFIDVLGRAGELAAADGLVASMPFEPDSVLWSSFLGACRVHGNVGRGAIAAVNEIMSRDSTDSSSLTLLSNLYTEIQGSRRNTTNR